MTYFVDSSDPKMLWLAGGPRPEIDAAGCPIRRPWGCCGHGQQPWGIGGRGRRWSGVGRHRAMRGIPQAGRTVRPTPATTTC